MTPIDKTPVIREKFEETLVDVLKGRPVFTKEGDVVLHADGTPVLERPAPADLTVIRGYLKDREPAKPEQPNVPKPGEPQGLLKGYADRKGIPFAGTRPQ